MLLADGAGAGKVAHLLQLSGSLNRQIAILPGVESISRRIEKIAAHGRCQGEDHGMAGPEEMHRPARAQSFFGRDNNVHQIGIAVGLHQGDHCAHRKQVKGQIGCKPARLLSQIRIGRALDGSS